MIRKRNNDIDKSSSTESGDSEEAEYNESREQDSQDMEGLEESDEEDVRIGVLEDESSGDGEGDSDESQTRRLRLLYSRRQARNAREMRMTTMILSKLLPNAAVD